MKINIVLYNPEIPQNTGNIMRTSVGTGAVLHLIEPFGFKFDLSILKRSGVNYLEHLEYHIYKDWQDFKIKNPGRYFFLTRYGRKSPDQCDFTKAGESIYLIFGKESTGIPKAILREHLDDCLRLPMTDKVRSLNLANTVSITVYEVLRQLGYPGLFREEPESLKGACWLEKE
ncbi:MAG TPA: tRNA (cytidine(34)-2'-O)-methyltransferase [Bacillota bacterium]|nr:tRNA (cytidine(34)-2'-O)-methyltransferase [Bacillota bacterium]HRX91433.1 tRNA (cytidine(34)-2'-O)-methyltransferase [Candidatus Izemoplasmatales bacterium]